MFARFSKIPLGIVLVVVLVAGLLTGAAIADSHDVFYACEKRGNIISGTVMFGQQPECRNGASLVSWNQSGIPGPTGPAGPLGPPGEDGADGADGAGVVYGFYRVERVVPWDIEPLISAFAICEEGDAVTGGGFVNPYAEEVPLGRYQPTTLATGRDAYWVTLYSNDWRPPGEESAWFPISAWAICADLTP
jgi:hypothetical protein